MKLVKTIKLYYQEGTSDKVYEVDLCEVDDNLYLVNFRYGRRSANLTEGTKTVFPVSLQEAEKTFNSLVNSKKKKGYSEAELPGYQAEKPVKIKQNSPEARNKTIIKYLKQAVKDEYEGDWEISRIIWRAGELKLTEAVKPIIELAKEGDEYIQYAACFALGRMLSADAVFVLEQISEQAKEEHLKRFSLLALMRNLDSDKRINFSEKLAGNLPAGLREPVLSRNVHVFNNQVNDYIFDENNTNKLFLWHLYVLAIEFEFIRPKLIEAIKSIPFKGNYFKPIRHIFKAAEMLEDNELLGILAYKFAKTEALVNADDYYVNINGRWFNVQDELKKGNHLIAYTKRTRAYFNRRILRNLIKLGVESEGDYTRLATEMLLPFSDKTDNIKPQAKYEYRYNRETRRYDSSVTHFDTYSSYITFYYILYAKSNRYLYKSGSKYWECCNDYVPGNEPPAEREEAFSELWDKAPKEIIRLLEMSRAERVHLFANKVFKANTEFEKEINIDNIINFLSGPFEITNKLGLDIAKKLYQPENPSVDLVLALLGSPLAEARLTAMNWILAKPELFFKDGQLLSGLICSEYSDVRDWLSGCFPKHLLLTQQSEILAKVIENVNKITGDELDSKLAAIGDFLVLHLQDAIKNLSGELLESLFLSKKDHLLIFGAKLLQASSNIEEKVTPYLSALLQSENKIVRQTGLEILSKFSERSLLDKSAMLASFCISELEDVRKSVRPVIQKLVNYNSDFAQGLINSFISIFTEKEPYDGLHEDLYQLFNNELIAHCRNISQDRISDLLKSSYQHAQMLGTSLFKKYISINTLSVEAIVRLANSDVLEIREICQKYFENNTAKIKYEKDEAIKLLDAKWKDTREFAFEYFNKNFTEKEWTPDLLIRICDSVKDDVQLFGRKLLIQFFKSENANEYLIKLSQHPGTNLQLFTSNYIEQYASGKPEIIKELRYYFKVVLRQINKGGVTKKRVFQFLENESLKSKETALVCLEILNEVSLTIAKGDKARCLEIMLAIKNKYPEMPSIFTEKEFITK